MSAILTITNQPCNGIPPTTTYGYYYNWWAAIGDTDGDGISEKQITSSSAWELPDWDDWLALALFLDPTFNYAINNSIGVGFREIGFEHWTDSGNSANDGTNLYGFGIKGSGGRSHSTGNIGSTKSTWRAWQPREKASTPSEGWTVNLVYSTAELGIGGSSVTGYSIDKNEGTQLIFLRKSTPLINEGDIGSYIGNNGKIYTTIRKNGWEWTTQPIEETLWRDGISIPQIATDASGNTAWINATSAAMTVP